MTDDVDRLATPQDAERLAPRPRRGPVIALAVVLIAAFALQTALERRLGSDEGVLEWAAVSIGALQAGRWYTPLTYVFVHAGLLHLVMNLTALMALGAPVVNRFPPTFRGVSAFFAFFLVTGVLAGLGFVALHPYGAAGAVGASGAICGLWGGATRLVDPYRPLSPVWSPTVWLNVKSLVKQNLVLIGILLVFSLMSSGQAVMIAWQAHLAGFVAGLLLIGAFLRLGGWPVAALRGEIVA